MIPFSRELWIDRDDFMEDAPKNFFRLSVGREVRLRAACYITCTEIVKDAEGQITELHCTWDPESRGGGTPDGRKIKGTIHWVSVKHAVPAEFRLYDRLFTVESPDGEEGRDFREFLNPESLRSVTGYVEPSACGIPAETPLQFERVGYFTPDLDGNPEAPVFNRTATLKDSWKTKA
jgi:glutaminyl-tRNA synthetase